MSRLTARRKRCGARNAHHGLFSRRAQREDPRKNRRARQRAAVPEGVPEIVPVDKKAAKALRKADKQVAKALRKGEHGRITPGNAKKVIGIVKIAGPVLAPFVLKAAMSTRERMDRSRARRLGVPVSDLAKYTGRGAGLHARIAGDVDALRELQEQASDSESELIAERYAKQTQERLDHLAGAVRAAERMPTQRRRSTHRAVDHELDRIEADLLNRFGVATKQR